MTTAIWVAVLAALLTGFFAWSDSKYNPWRETWERWEGTIITGIKLAEKQIPDDAANKSLRRLDAALRYVVEAYTTAHGREPNARLAQEIKDAIGSVHASLEESGGLPGKSGVPKVTGFASCGATGE